MANEPLIVVIMAGGAGTRFWPLSTERRPKQFLSLLGGRSLLQQSFDRVIDLVPPERIIVLTAEPFLELVTEQLPELPCSNIIGEPMRRDTAAAVALGAFLIERRHGRAMMAVLTADHHIEPTAAFHQALSSAASGASRDRRALYTFGLTPSYPATAYGYLHLGNQIGEDRPLRHYQLRGFREKPDSVTAQAYLKSGDYYWNSGMFVWSIEAIVAELDHHLPEHSRHLRRATEAEGTPGFSEALRQAFEQLPAISIDYAVMEKAERVCCVVPEFRWNDVGGWLALGAFLDQDQDHNASRARLHTLGAKNNVVFSEDPEEHVALLGVEGLIVVRAGKKTLVAHQRKCEQLKHLVGQLDENLR
jgi:mannose-1-phosphate guanylyltransferase